MCEQTQNTYEKVYSFIILLFFLLDNVLTQ